MTSRHRTIGTIAIAVTILTIAFVRIQTSRVPSGRREIPLQPSKAWTVEPYTHDSTGQLQGTAIKLADAPDTAQPGHAHPLPEVELKRTSTSMPYIKANDKTPVVDRSQAGGETVDDMHRAECDEASDGLPITYVGTQAF